MEQKQVKYIVPAEQVARIRRCEALMDEAEKALSALESAMEDFMDVQDSVAELDRYYQSPEWRQDFADDEAGRFPEDLKRGVLSEDGLYSLLCRNQEYRNLIMTRRS